MGRTRVFFLAIAVALAPFNAGTAFACTCTDLPPVCEAYWEATTVFTGLVVEVTAVEVPLGTGGDTFAQILVRFAVEEPFRGVDTAGVDVYTAPSEALCGLGLREGERYLVYGYRDEAGGRVTTNLCTRTAPVAAAAEDLAYIRGLSDAGTEGRVSGVVNVYTGGGGRGSEQFVGPIAGMTVVLAGAGQRFEATTDAAGGFAFEGMPAGAYRARTRMPSGAWTRSKSRVEVHAGGCTRLDIDARVGKKAL